MNRRLLTKLALYVLQALLGAGAILAAIAFLGGLTYLVEAQRNANSDMWSEILQIFRTESVLVVVGTALLFWIGTVRTYMARIRGTELRKTKTISQPR